MVGTTPVTAANEAMLGSGARLCLDPGQFTPPFRGFLSPQQGHLRVDLGRRRQHPAPAALASRMLIGTNKKNPGEAA